VTPTERQLLETLLAIPTAPLREHRVRAALEHAAAAAGLESRCDRWGNLYVAYRRGTARPLALTAHMDHPGFEITEGGARARATFLGGVGAAYMSGAPVLCFDAGRAGTTDPPAGVRGRIVRTTSVPVAGRRPDVVLDLDLESPVEPGAFGVFDLPGSVVDGGTLRGRALDNLLSCVLVLSTLASLRRRAAAADVVGVFTRAEEVGFVGAGGVLREALLEPERPIVVLETSKELPGFRIGAGPVLRVGDRMTCFDPAMDLWLVSRAAALAAREPDFAWQRALMPGGACEASLYLLYGRRVGALALPLGNYHNMTPEGGIGPEYVSLSDFDHALELLENLAENPPEPGAGATQRGELDAAFARWEERLGATG
jgi:endoglucanase